MLSYAPAHAPVMGMTSDRSRTENETRGHEHSGTSGAVMAKKQGSRTENETRGHEQA